MTNRARNIDWYDRCQTAEAELLVSEGLLADAKAEIDRLHAFLDGDAAEIMRLIREIERLRRALEPKP
jgi:hypothetical protein